MATETFFYKLGDVRIETASDASGLQYVTVHFHGMERQAELAPGKQIVMALSPAEAKTLAGWLTEKAVSLQLQTSSDQ